MRPEAQLIIPPTKVQISITVGQSPKLINIVAHCTAEMVCTSNTYH